MIRQAHGAARLQRLRLFQIECVETLGEPATDLGEKIEGLLPLAMLIAARPGLCLLLARGPTMAKTYSSARGHLALESVRYWQSGRPRKGDSNRGL
jgi:hypothetical protein